MREYDLRLQFDPEEDGFLPGAILLEAPAKGVRLEGRFRAEIRGLRLVDGRPDLHSDAFETLEFAAQLYLQRKLDTDNVVILKGSDHRYSTPAGRGAIPWGSLDVEYRANDQPSAIARVQLLKGAQGWEVKRDLPLHQLAQAHPLSRVQLISAEFEHMAAAAIEEDLNEQFPGKAIFWLQTGVFSHRRSAEVAHKIVKCRLEGVDEPIERNYLFRRANGEWQIVGTISLDESIDSRTGEIVARKQP